MNYKSTQQYETQTLTIAEHQRMKPIHMCTMTLRSGVGLNSALSY